MIQVKNIYFSYTGMPMYTEASFTIGEHQKVGLVGPNGAGKSTLFKLLMGEEQVSEGDIEITSKMGFVPQEVRHDPNLQEAKTIREYLDPREKKQDYELKTMLMGLELERIDLYEAPKNMSGGQKTKLALARALIQEPDILLLDEPTNFMDTAGKKWVMDFLSTYPNTLLLVSHDIKLMDNAIDKIIAVNTFTNKLDEYTGTYSEYIKQKSQRDALLKRHIIQEQKHINHMKEAVEKMAGRKSKKGVRQRIQLQKRIARIQENLPEMPKELARIKIHLPDPIWIGEIPLKAVDIEKSYKQKRVLDKVSLTIYRGERIALIGHNGAGKSTFIKILMGIINKDSGEVIYDSKLKIGYYSQELELFDEEKTLLDVVQDSVAMDSGKVRGFLARFLFTREKVYQKIATLSGGEKTRLSIALLMLQDYNLLILDEPTTYLDLLSQRIILEALKEYRGAMLIVSHTQEFIKELAPQRVLLLPENDIVYFSDELLERVGISEDLL